MTPPRWARWLLRWLAPPDRAEDVLGDLEEVHRGRVGRRGRMLASFLTGLEALDIGVALLGERIWRRGTIGERMASVEPGPNRPSVSWLDFKLGLRMLVKYPGLTLVGGLGMAVAIAIAAGSFGVIYSLMDPTLPLDEGARVVTIQNWDAAISNPNRRSHLHGLMRWREELESVEDLGGFRTVRRNLVPPDGEVEPIRIAEMTASGFRLARVPPFLGRPLVEEDEREGAPPVVVIGYDVWQNRFAGDPRILGRTLQLGDTRHMVVGVMPEGFAFPIAEEIWVPLRMDPADLERGEGTTLEVFGRLAPGVSMDQAAAEFTTIARRLALEYPETNEGVGAVIKPYTEEFIGEEPVALLYTMLGAVFAVLLIACANVANLLLARAAARSKEVAVRSALGASRWRVVGQMLAETFVMALVGAAIGLGIAWAGVSMFNRAIVDTQPPYWIDIRIDPLAVAFVLGLALLATLMAGIIPAVKASGSNAGDILKDESRGSSSLRLGRITKGLVVAEIALSCGLLVAAGLMVKSVVQLRTIDYQFPTENIFTARVGLFEAQYPDSLARRRFYQDLVERLRAIPGAEAAAVTTNLPGTFSGSPRFAVDGENYERDVDYPRAHVANVTPEFFETFHVDALEGRVLTRQDAHGNLPVAVVNRTFASRFFPNESPLGRRIRIGTADSERPWRTIVGVVPDLHMDGVENEEPEGFYLPLYQSDTRFASMAVRVRDGRDAMAVAPEVRDAVLGVDQDLPIYWVRTLEETIAGNTWFYYVFGTLFMVFGGVALFLATIGLYGVMAFAVSRRTSELGVRMALGAQTRDVLRLVLRQGLLQLAIGLVLGLVLAAGLANMLQIILFDVEPRDPMIFLGIIGVLTATGLLASLIPAQRASRIDPLVALRYE